MPAYVRVELHEKSSVDRPTAGDYVALHTLLSTKGIERKVDVATVGEQCLPSGLYYTKANDKNTIGADVSWAAKQIGFPYSYVVVISAGALVHNLQACKC
jgi:hypothetical protein